MTKATAPQASQPDIFLFGATMICLVQFSGVWLWPVVGGAAVLDPDNAKPLGSLFNLVVYAVTLALLARHVLAHGTSLLLKATALFMPLIVWSFVCCLIGFQPATSLRACIIWSMTILAGALIGLEVERPVLVRWFLLYAAAALWGSVFWSTVLPSLGALQGYWRGLFLQKNFLGLVAALTLVTILAIPFRRYKLLAIAAGAPATLCLLFSGAKTALVAVAGVAVYQMVLRVKHRTVEARFCSILLLMAVFTLVPLYGLDLILGLLGKDPTLTGRTVVWSLYLQKALESPVWGFGPGAFDGFSDITSSFLQGLEQYGEIRTPHNLYLTFFGDTGLVGVFLLVLILARLSLGYAATDLSYQYRWPALIAFAVVVEGMAEALQGFSNSIVYFILPAAFASALPKAVDARRPTGVPRRPAPAVAIRRHPAPGGSIFGGRLAP